MMRTSSVLIALFVAPLVVAAPLGAKEAKLRLPDALKAAAKAEDYDRWIAHIRLVPLAYPVADKKTRRALMLRLGEGLKTEVMDVARAALDAIERTGDGELAWSVALRKVMPNRKQEGIEPFQMRVFAALYTLAPNSAIDTLALLMRKAKSADVASWAMRAMGGYERSKRRVFVLSEIASVLMANAPGANRRKWGEGSPRWRALMPFVAPTLNALTGQQMTVPQWGAAWQENRKTPQKLFVRPLPK